MNQEEFNAYIAQGYNRIPLMREVLADLDTPLSTYLKLADGPYSYLFESVQGGEKWGRYSIIGLPSRKIVRVSGNEITVVQDGKIEKNITTDDPLDWIEKFQQQYKVPEIEGLPKFNGGLVGYFGYDTIRYIEPRLKECPNPDQLELPDILLMVSDELVVHDNLGGKLYIIVHADENGFERVRTRIGHRQAQTGGKDPRVGELSPDQQRRQGRYNRPQRRHLNDHQPRMATGQHAHRALRIHGPKRPPAHGEEQPDSDGPGDQRHQSVYQAERVIELHRLSHHGTRGYHPISVSSRASEAWWFPSG